MANVAPGVRLSNRRTVTDRAVRTYGWDFPAGSAAAVVVSHNDTVLTRDQYEVELSESGAGGVVTLLRPLQTSAPVTLAVGDTITISRDTSVVRSTSFPRQGYASAAGVEILAGHFFRILEELTARTETHAEIIISGNDLKPFALLTGRGIRAEDLDPAFTDRLVADVELDSDANELVVEFVDGDSFRIPLPTGGGASEGITQVQLNACAGPWCSVSRRWRRRSGTSR